MIYHIVVGDIAATPLKEAVANEPGMQGEVTVMKDILHVGPIQKQDGEPFSTMRSNFWQQVAPNDKNPIVVDDMERLLEISNQMYKDEASVAWLWLAPAPADVCAYYWMLPYLSKHKGRFYVVNIAGLPFLDEAGKVFYPKSIGEILPKELIKARKLARQITPSETETDIYDWSKMVEENGGIRTHEGGKKIASRGEDYYDNQLLSFCSHQFQKASRIVSQALNKYNVPTGDLYLGWRLKELANNGKIITQGDMTKTLRDFDIKLPGSNTATNEPMTQ